jgi:predicted nucleic acid-binding protein
MILLDTNVISDVYRERPNPDAQKWLISQKPSELYLCAPVLAELYSGAERLPQGGRRRRLEEWIRRIEIEGFPGRVLPFDQSASRDFGWIFQRRKSVGRPIGILDALIAAIARSNGAALATRDIDDFTEVDLTLLNPFEP